MAAQGWRDWQAQNNRPVDATVAQIRAHYHNKMNEWAAWNKRAANPENRVMEDRVYFKDCHGKVRSARRLPAELEHLISELHKSLPRPGYTKKKSDTSNYEADGGFENVSHDSNTSLITRIGINEANNMENEEMNRHLMASIKVEKDLNKPEGFENMLQSQQAYGQRILPPANTRPLTRLTSNSLGSNTLGPNSLASNLMASNSLVSNSLTQNQLTSLPVEQYQHPNQSRSLDTWTYNQYSQYSSTNTTCPTYPPDPRNGYSLQSLLHPKENFE